MRKDKYEKRNTLIFYSLTILIGVLICIVSCAFVFNFLSDKPSSTDPNQNSSSVRMNKFTALVNDIEDNSLKIFNLNTEINSSIKINSQTQFFDKNDVKINISKLKPGDLVDIASQNGEVKTLSLNKSVWEKNYITNFEIDRDKKELRYCGQKYFFDKHIFIKDNKDINKISGLSLVSIRGTGEKIWYLEVNKGTGFINISNSNKIINGTIRIDSNSPIGLKNIRSKELSCGPHNIFVAGDNIEFYSRDFFIDSDETLDIDLSVVELKSGLLKLNIDQADCVVYIDNKKTVMNELEPILLNYGVHDLKITKPDFNDYVNKFVIDSAERELNIKLTKKINLGKVKIITNPDGARVYMDDTLIGRSPIETQVEYGKHTFHIKKDGYASVKLPVNINKEQNNYEANLELLNKKQNIESNIDNINNSSEENDNAQSNSSSDIDIGAEVSIDNSVLKQD